MASEALKKIYESNLEDDKKKDLSALLLAYQGLAKESYDKYSALSSQLPIKVGEKGIRRKERQAWVSYAQCLLSEYEKDKENYDRLVAEISSSNLLDIVNKYLSS